MPESKAFNFVLITIGVFEKTPIGHFLLETIRIDNFCNLMYS